MKGKPVKITLIRQEEVVICALLPDSLRKLERLQLEMALRDGCLAGEPLANDLETVDDFSTRDLPPKLVKVEPLTTRKGEVREKLWPRDGTVFYSFNFVKDADDDREEPEPEGRAD